VDDADLQLSFALPAAAAANPWRNLFAPPIARAAPVSDRDVLSYVRESNYFDPSGGITLARVLRALPPQWDSDHDGRWNGYIPDAWFHFDERGFDRAADGRATGWRAFAYAPFLGAFFPTNGAMDDVLIRLDPALREDAAGKADERVYAVNLAVVETLISRADVAIEPVDERALGRDLDLDGRLGRAVRVAFRAPQPGRAAGMHYVGRAGALQDRGEFPLGPGLFPLGTEFLHSVRYIDVGARGQVAIAARMKELRYAKKVRWLTPADLKARAAAEVTEQAESADGVLQFLWQFDRGIYNDQGWLLQGFIEAADGHLRPQSYEESLACVGCHGEIGATTDSMFAFARKLGRGTPSQGWFHWTQHDLHGIPEPRRRDGRYEYSFYLANNGAADDLRENHEAWERFFDAGDALKPAALEKLHTDVSVLLLPSAARALDLDRASMAIARAQAFAAGREPVLSPTQHAHQRAPVDEKTGVALAVDGPMGPVGSEDVATVTRRPGPRGGRRP
jgi:hypothetical protein